MSIDPLVPQSGQEVCWRAVGIDDPEKVGHQYSRDEHLWHEDRETAVYDADDMLTADPPFDSVIIEKRTALVVVERDDVIHPRAAA